MKSNEALRVLADLTAYQWGMVTSAQASVHGITRLDLSRLAEAGHLERLAHGVYKDAGAPGDQFDDLRAAWLSTDPKRLAHDRNKDREGGVVVAGPSAARLHGIGDLWDRRYDFVTPTRRQSQRSEIRYRQRHLDPRDVTLVEGLPVMSIEYTIADLFNAEADTSHIADALRDASSNHKLDVDRLRVLLAPHAKREGFRKGNGSALLNLLMEIAGIDADTLSGRIAATKDLGSRVVAKYLDQVGALPLTDLIGNQESVKAMREAIASLDKATEGKLMPTIDPSVMKGFQEATRALMKAQGIQDPLKKAMPDPAVLKTLRKAGESGGALREVDFTVTPEMSRLVENAQRAMKNV